MRFLLALVCLLPTLAFAQITFAPVADGTYQPLAGKTVAGSISVRLNGCPTGPWQFTLDVTPAPFPEGGCPFDYLGDQQLLDTKTLSNGAHTISAKGPTSTLTAAFTVANGAPNPPGDPAWTGTATVTWLRPTTNTDGTPLADLAGYRLFYGTSAGALTQTVQIPNPATLTYQLTGLTAGTWYAAARSYTTGGAQSDLSNTVSTTLTAPPVTCGASPAVESRTQACVAPLVGSWTQTSAWTSVAAPACWVATWLPTTAPAGVCANPPPTNRVTSDTQAYELRGTTTVPTLTLIALVPLGASCGPQTQVVKGVTYCRLSLWRADGSLQVAVISFPVDLKLTGVWAKAAP